MGILRTIIAVTVITLVLILGSATPATCSTSDIAQAPDGVSILI